MAQMQLASGSVTGQYPLPACHPLVPPAFQFNLNVKPTLKLSLRAGKFKSQVQKGLKKASR
jgi:hypothetical protein